MAGTTVWDIPDAELLVSHRAAKVCSSVSSISAACQHTWTPLCVCACSGSHLVRLVPAHYQDGVYHPLQEPQLPNPRGLSSLLTAGPSGLPSARNQTVLSLFFGKYIIHAVAVKRNNEWMSGQTWNTNWHKLNFCCEEDYFPTISYRF